jgi:hypothetical protein
LHWTLDIGLGPIRQACPLFNAWVEWMEKAGGV